MDAVVLDTDVLSFFAKGDTRGAAYAPAIIGKQMCLSFQTVAELRLWALVRRWGAARQAGLDALLRRFVVLPYDAAMADQWAHVTAHCRSVGKPIDCGDAWIAASALRHRATLVTHNAKHYANVPGLTCISRES